MAFQYWTQLIGSIPRGTDDDDDLRGDDIDRSRQEACVIDEVLCDLA
jgi:hypothetical protein